MNKLYFAALALPFAAPAMAVTIYTDAASFTAATGAVQYSFADPGVATDKGTTTSLGKATISAQQMVLFSPKKDPDYGASTAFLGTSGAPDPSDPDGTLQGTLTISSTENFLGIDLGSFFGAARFSYSVDNGPTSFLTIAGAPGDTFIGFTDTGPITFSLTIPDGETSEVDVLHTYTGKVPEPATWAMMIGGFGMVGASMRRRRAKVTFQQG